MNRRFFTLSLLTICCFALRGQDFTASLTGGYLCSTAPRFSYIQTHTIGFDAAVSWDASGDTYWKQWWRRPTYGVRTNFTYVEDGIAGSRFGIAGFMQSPLWRPKKINLGVDDPINPPHFFYWEADVGFSLYSKPFEFTHDENNEFIGTFLNCMLQLGLGYRYTFEDQSALQLGLKIVHTSNGQLTTHNQGLNYLQWELGYRLAPGETQDHSAKAAESPDSVKADWHPSLYLAYAPSVVLTRNSHSTGRYYHAYTAQLGGRIHMNECLSFGLTADMMYNYSHAELYRIRGIDYHHKFYLGSSVMVEPRWGPVSLRAAVGWYLFGLRSELVDTPYYERFGAFYHFGRQGNQAVGVAMKLHKARIDYIEWTYSIDLFK